MSIGLLVWAPYIGRRALTRTPLLARAATRPPARSLRVALTLQRQQSPRSSTPAAKQAAQRADIADGERNATSLSRSLIVRIRGSRAAIIALLSLLAAGAVLHRCVIDTFTGHGPSMMPTCNISGEVYLVLSSQWATIDSGDIVVAVKPGASDRAVCKRVIGVGGDSVRSDPRDPLSLVTVPAGHVWLQGDNLPYSVDSREYGPVPVESVRGKVMARIWPLWRTERLQPTLKYRGW